MQAEVAVSLVGKHGFVCLNNYVTSWYLLTILCREEPAKCSDVANPNSADITNIQCETYELAVFGEEYEMIPAFERGQQVQEQQDSGTQNVPTS